MSFGIGEDISFDSEIIEKYNCKVYAFDPTPKSINWIKNKSDIPSELYFYEYGIGLQDRFFTFYLPENKNYVSGSIVKSSEKDNIGIEVPMHRFITICDELNNKNINVFKMDIEGAEYAVIPEILESGIKIKQILIEFHHRFFSDGFTKNNEIISVLRSKGFKIFAVSDNIEEVSFIKID